MGWLEACSLVGALALVACFCRTEYRWRVASLGRRTSDRQNDGGGA